MTNKRLVSLWSSLSKNKGMVQSLQYVLQIFMKCEELNI